MISLVVFLPLVFAALLWFTPKESLIRPLALGFSLFEFLISLYFVVNFDKGSADLQFVEQLSWVPAAGIQYFVALDGISLWLFILTTFLLPLTILGSWTGIDKKVKGFHVSLFMLQTSMLGTFVAFDSILFFTFFETSLIPMYFIIGIWGGSNRVYASMKFFIFTMAGSIFLLLGIITLILLTKDQLGYYSANLLDFYSLNIPFITGTFFNTQTMLLFMFSLAFAIKVPMFPVHTWLPDAHVQAPTAGSVILAGVMLKMGTYGFIRMVIPMFPEAVHQYAWLFMLLGAVGIIYGALVAMVQTDIKKLVAYSSVSHMGYIILGLFALNVYGYQGSLIQMLNHGISTGALFLLVGMIYEKTHSREISKYGGLAVVAPKYAIFFIIVTLSSIAVPLTNGFIGEFLILLGAFKSNVLFASISVLGVILGASYMLWLVKRVFFGPSGELIKEHSKVNLDLNKREIAVLVPFVVLIFWLGIAPNHVLDYSKKSVERLSQQGSQYSLKIKETESK